MLLDVTSRLDQPLTEGAEGPLDDALSALLGSMDSLEVVLVVWSEPDLRFRRASADEYRFVLTAPSHSAQRPPAGRQASRTLERFPAGSVLIDPSTPVQGRTTGHREALNELRRQGVQTVLLIDGPLPVPTSVGDDVTSSELPTWSEIVPRAGKGIDELVAQLCRSGPTRAG